MSLEKQVLHWFAIGETGESSKAMALASCGMLKKTSHPYDPADLNRCLKLIAMIPEIKSQFPMIAGLSDTWQRLINRWDELEKSFIDEVGFNWSNGKSAPKTYKLMNEILNPKGE